MNRKMFWNVLNRVAWKTHKGLKRQLHLAKMMEMKGWVTKENKQQKFQWFWSFRSLKLTMFDVFNADGKIWNQTGKKRMLSNNIPLREEWKVRRDKRVKIVKTKQSSKINFLWYKCVWYKPMEVDFENEKTGWRRVGKS